MRYKTYVKRIDRAPFLEHVNIRLTCFFLPYVNMRFEKHEFYAWYEKHAFTITRKPYDYIWQPMH